MLYFVAVCVVDLNPAFKKFKFDSHFIYFWVHQRVDYNMVKTPEGRL